jgi:prevent-host-death family protein
MAIMAINKEDSTMITFGASEAKNEFGRLLDTAQRESVMIEKKGRGVVVVLSLKDYEELEEAQDALWAMMADKAKKDGLMSVEDSEALLTRIANAKD